MFFFGFSVDTGLRLTSWDDSLRRLACGLPRDFDGKPYWQVFPKIYVGEKDAIDTVIASRTSIDLPGYPLTCLVGRVVANISIMPTFDDRGAVSGAQVSGVIPTGCPLSQRLQSAQTLVDIGTVSTTLAHGVRNPLNAIKGAVIYLNDKYQFDTVVVEFTKIISEEIDRLDSFITRFLSTSLIDRDFRTVSLPELLERIIAVVSFQLKAKRITLHQKFGPVPLIPLDTFNLEHAILNILNNSISVLSPGGEITLATRTDSRAGEQCVVLEVSDNGPGFAADADISHVISEESSRTGRGFGLFITREIIQYHGGTMEVKTGRGQGTTITIYLPVGERFEGQGHD